MNRAGRRAAAQALPAIVRQFAALAVCPDCDSDVTLQQDGPLYRLTLAHDATCPWLAQHTTEETP